MASAAVDLLDKLYEMVQEAFSLPFGADRCILDRDKVLGLLDEIRHTLPEDIKHAHAIVESRNEVLTNAKKEADATKRQAEERAKKMVSQDEIINAAKKRANDIVHNAEVRARETKKAATDYLDDALKKTEESIAQSLGDVRKTRSEFRSVMSRGK